MFTESELLLRLQTEVLEAVACGEPLAKVADLLCRNAEKLATEALCSILIVDENGALQPLAAPSLSPDYSALISGLQPGENVGSCGTAVYRKQPVVVTDIAKDPLWDNFRALVAPFGLKACWSSPIKDQDGNVVATFAFYYKSARAPSEVEKRIVATCVHLCAIAISQEKVRQHTYYLAYYDALTGLPNRAKFNELVCANVRADKPFGLLLADIDHLKMVNDTVGHTAGDLLIKTVASRLFNCHPGLTACRLGGDEFAVLVADCDNEDTLQEAADHVLAAVRGIIENDENALYPHLTIGGALIGPDCPDHATLTQNADVALYHAKETHRGGFVPFAPSLRSTMQNRATMVRSVDKALREGRMVPHYQPIVKFDTAEIVGMEALARMQMADGRMATASEFHAALADPRIAWQLTGQMLRQVAIDIRHWLDLGIPLQHVGINVTVGDFQRGDLEDRIVEVFGKADVPLQHLILEVNEAVFMEGSDQMVPRAVSALRKRGLLVALDDFGTGFASLTHLLSFPVDIIKIDRSFVTGLGTDRTSDVVVGSIIDIARKLDMKLVAEGIETEDQAGLLNALGCKLGQGYLFGRPISASEATQMLTLFAQRSVSSHADERLSA